MKSIFHFKFKAALWLVVFLFSLLCQGQTAKAQFGLFDTVWTMNGLPQNYEIRVSPNDSLFLLWTHEKTQNAGVYIKRTRLFSTYSKNVIWDTTGIAFPAILSDSKTVISWDSNKIILRNLLTLEPISTVIHQNIPITDAKFVWQGVSEFDTSQYIAGYINYTDLKGVSGKFNYLTGQTTIMSDSIPYFAMTISEDGQYVAGVYYTGGTASNVPYNEVIEVRKISDYSVVFRKESKYCDYTPNFTPYQWVTNYNFKFSKDNKFLALNYGFRAISVYNLEKKDIILFLLPNLTATYCAFSTNNTLIFLKNFNNLEKEQLVAIYNCESEKYSELEHLDKSNIVTGFVNDLVFDKYLLNENTYSCNTENGSFHRIGDVALLKLNFDLNTIKIPEEPIQGILYPNPTNNNINLTLDIKTPVQLNYSIYNETGQLIKLLLDEFTNPGLITNSFEVSDLPTGSYFLRITGERFSQTYKVIINR